MKKEPYYREPESTSKRFSCSQQNGVPDQMNANTCITECMHMLVVKVCIESCGMKYLCLLMNVTSGYSVALPSGMNFTNSKSCSV